MPERGSDPSNSEGVELRPPRDFAELALTLLCELESKECKERWPSLANEDRRGLVVFALAGQALRRRNSRGRNERKIDPGGVAVRAVVKALGHGITEDQVGRFYAEWIKEALADAAQVKYRDLRHRRTKPTMLPELARRIHRGQAVLEVLDGDGFWPRAADPRSTIRSAGFRVGLGLKEAKVRAAGMLSAGCDPEAVRMREREGRKVPVLTDSDRRIGHDGTWQIGARSLRDLLVGNDETLERLDRGNAKEREAPVTLPPDDLERVPAQSRERRSGRRNGADHYQAEHGSVAGTWLAERIMAKVEMMLAKPRIGAARRAVLESFEALMAGDLTLAALAKRKCLKANSLRKAKSAVQRELRALLEEDQ